MTNYFKKYIVIGSFVFGIIFLLINYLDGVEKAKSLNENGLFIVAKVENVEYKRIYYSFQISNNLFESSIGYYNINLPPYKVGDKLIVKYYTLNPLLNRALFLDKRKFIHANYNQLLDTLIQYEFSSGDIGNSY